MDNDLISRSALLDALRDTEFCMYVPLDEIDAVVYNAHAVDAEPVRHGHWVHCKGKSNLWYCSECGEKIIYNPTRKTYGPHKKAVFEVNKRCRSCGAKMDGREDPKGHGDTVQHAQWQGQGHR